MYSNTMYSKILQEHVTRHELAGNRKSLDSCDALPRMHFHDTLGQGSVLATSYRFLSILIEGGLDLHA